MFQDLSGSIESYSSDKCHEILVEFLMQCISSIDSSRLGGSECLDYISIYHNPGNETSSAHWHYVTFGFSDLHGDGRVHK